MTACAHVVSVQIAELPESVAGCEECLESGSPWCHLRMCMTCGHVGCCDSSPNKHATAHAISTDHPIMRSVQPGENWAWCYVDQVAMVLPQVTGEPTIPPSPLCP
jgi:uncharacterized UBP type Zn finger protein